MIEMEDWRFDTTTCPYCHHHTCLNCKQVAHGAEPCADIKLPGVIHCSFCKIPGVLEANRCNKSTCPACGHFTCACCSKGIGKIQDTNNPNQPNHPNVYKQHFCRSLESDPVPAPCRIHAPGEKHCWLLPSRAAGKFLDRNFANEHPHLMPREEE